MITLHFLGLGGAFLPELGNTAACFQKGQTLYLLDCGSTVFGELIRRDLLGRAQQIVVLLSHTHADHVGSLGTLISWCHHIKQIPVKVVHPSASVQALLRLNGILDDRYQMIAAPLYEDENIRAQFLPVPHTKAIPAFGMLLNDAQETIYYSGDAGALPDDVWKRFLSGEIARVYQDASLTDSHYSAAHGSYCDFLLACPQALRSRFFPIHLNKDYRATILADGFGQAW